ncbi:MAG TPA: Gfo/Idh/MocA family oxidoreductase [Lacunisphaera sp.]|nr:Gfo/Idh/MocA family oxidoreductase [Lacunisphaera sp.]
MAAERRINFALIGTGSIARVHAQAVAAVPSACLRGVHGRNPERSRELATEFGGEAFGSLEALLSVPEIDAVCITTPSGLHGAHAIAALEAGKHVLCEKPLEITTRRIDEMMAAARRHQRILAGVFQFRFGRGAQLLKRAIEAGRFGRLSLCSAYVKWWRAPDYYRASTWRGTAALDGGGALINQAIHAIDLLQWLAGRPTRVHAATRTRAHPIEVEDTAAAVLEFEHGALGVVEAATSCYPGQQLRIEISGEHGTAILENDRLVRWQFATPEPGDDERCRETTHVIGGGAADPKAIGIEGHRRIVEDLVHAILAGSPPAVPPEDARHAVAIIEAIYESSRLGRPVAVGS